MLTSFFIVGSSLPFASFLLFFERCFHSPPLILWLCDLFVNRKILHDDAHVWWCVLMLALVWAQWRVEDDTMDDEVGDHIEANKTNTRAFRRRTETERKRANENEKKWKRKYLLLAFPLTNLKMNFVTEYIHTTQCGGVPVRLCASTSTRSHIFLCIIHFSCSRRTRVCVGSAADSCRQRQMTFCRYATVHYVLPQRPRFSYVGSAHNTQRK